MKKTKSLLLSILALCPLLLDARTYDLKELELSELPTQFNYEFKHGDIERLNGSNYSWHLPWFSGDETAARFAFDLRLTKDAGWAFFSMGHRARMSPRISIHPNGKVRLQKCGGVSDGSYEFRMPADVTPGDLMRFTLEMDLTDTTEGRKGSMTLLFRNLTRGGEEIALTGVEPVDMGYTEKKNRAKTWRRINAMLHGDSAGRTLERLELFTNDAAEQLVDRQDAAWAAKQLPTPRMSLNQSSYSFADTCKAFGIAFPTKFSFCNGPAYRWQDAMASGNGLVGLLQHGDPLEEIFIFNSHRFVAPKMDPFVPVPDMSDQLEKLQDGLLAGKYGDSWHEWVDVLWERTGHKRSLWTQPFHAGYRLRFNVYPEGQTDYKSLKDYLRVNNYENGEIIVKWTDDSGDWVRRTFTSRVEGEDLIVTQLEAPSGADLDFVLTLDEAEGARVPHDVLVDDDYLNMRVTYDAANGGHGGFEGVTRVIAEGAKKTHLENGMRITGARKVLLVTKLARYKDDYNEWDRKQLQKELAQIQPDYERLLKPHAAVHSEMFNRVDFTLGASEADRHLSNEVLMDREMADRSEIDKALMERVFYTSRYLFMASAGSEYAPRLIGMFSGSWHNGWAGDYTTDANVNFAVLGGNITNLPESMEGYFSVIERTVHQWRNAAQQFWGCRGIIGPIRIDGEAAAPLHLSKLYAHNAGAVTGPWLLAPMFEHYKITGDKTFLKERLYPLLVEQALFYEDFLTRTDEKGKYIFVPSYSPENHVAKPGQPRAMASVNSTFDIAGAKHTLRMAIEAQRDLGLPEGEDTRKWKAMLDKMPDYLVNDVGALAEWSWEGYGESYTHRHSSHMYVVWPSYEINLENPETAHLVPNVRTALDKRGLRITSGHDALMKSIARIRVKQSGEVYKTFKYMLENKYFFNSLTGSHDYRHRIYNYDAILCWQGLVAETAVFTNDDLLELLPAMPEAFDEGMLQGIKGRNQLTVNALKWDLNKGEIHCRVTSDIDQEITLMHRNGIRSIKADAALSSSELGTHARRLQLKKGTAVTVSIKI